MPIMQEGRGKRMPFLFLSPSTQYFNPYVTTGDERYWMNALADEMMPYLHASGITVTRNDPDGSAAQSIRDSNASRQDFHLALHSNAAPQALAGQLRGVDFYYYPTSEAGLRMANILVDNMKTIYPLPDRVQARPSTIIGEVRRTRVPAVLAEIGYHDNVDDANWLSGNLDAVARTAICACARTRSRTRRSSRSSRTARPSPSSAISTPGTPSAPIPSTASPPSPRFSSPSCRWPNSKKGDPFRGAGVEGDQGA